MKSELHLQVGADDLPSVYVGRSFPDFVNLTFSERHRHPSGSIVSLRCTTAQFEALAEEGRKRILEARRMSAVARGEAVPALEVSRGEAAEKLLRSVVDAYAAGELVSDDIEPIRRVWTTTEREEFRRAFMAAAVFVRKPVA